MSGIELMNYSGQGIGIGSNGYSRSMGSNFVDGLLQSRVITARAAIVITGNAIMNGLYSVPGSYRYRWNAQFSNYELPRGTYKFTSRSFSNVSICSS